MFCGFGQKQEECTPLVHSSCFGAIDLGFLLFHIVPFNPADRSGFAGARSGQIGGKV